MPVDPRMSEWGNPPRETAAPGGAGGERGELKHLSTPRNRK